MMIFIIVLIYGMLIVMIAADGFGDAHCDD
jgi:hypothetical protein